MEEINDLGFGIEINCSNNYPEGFVSERELKVERKMTWKIMNDLGVDII